MLAWVVPQRTHREGWDSGSKESGTKSSGVISESGDATCSDESGAISFDDAESGGCSPCWPTRRPVAAPMESAGAASKESTGDASMESAVISSEASGSPSASG